MVGCIAFGAQSASADVLAPVPLVDTINDDKGVNDNDNSALGVNDNQVGGVQATADGRSEVTPALPPQLGDSAETSSEHEILGASAQSATAPATVNADLAQLTPPTHPNINNQASSTATGVDNELSASAQSAAAPQETSTTIAMSDTTPISAAISGTMPISGIMPIAGIAPIAETGNPHYENGKLVYGSDNHTVGGNISASYYKWTTKNGVTYLDEASSDNYDLVYYLDTTKKGTQQSNPSSDIKDKVFFDLHNTTNSGYQSGGAIYINSSSTKIDKIEADFVGNSVTSDTDADGGAIANHNGNIGSIIGNFINNSIKAIGCDPGGGAILNYYGSSIGSIIGDFIGNSATNTNGSGSYFPHGGAIANTTNAKITSITGNFIGNYTVSESASPVGGAISNENNSSIGVTGENSAQSGITSSFVRNYAISTSGSASGGAIYNTATITSITGKDYTLTQADIDALPDALKKSEAKDGDTTYRYGAGDKIKGFFGNYAKSTTGSAQGGAIYNGGSGTSTIDKITADFIGNYAQITSQESTSGSAQGGAIYNESSINSITGNFIGNKVSGVYNVSGGAIYNANNGNIGTILGNFIGNSLATQSHEGTNYNAAVKGTAIYNAGTITNIGTENNQRVLFQKNTASSPSYIGGVIFNVATISNIYAEFDNNYTHYGSIYNSTDGTIDSIDMIFKNSSMESNNDSIGLGIYNKGKIHNITNGQFFTTALTNSTTSSYGGVSITNLGEIGNFADDGTWTSGGMKASFYKNTLSMRTGAVNEAKGGALFNNTGGKIGDITGVDMTVEGESGKINGFYNNSVSSTSSNAKGGAIYNAGYIHSINTTFHGNSANASGGTNNQVRAYGGAIYNAANATITNIGSDRDKTVFSDNKGTAYVGAMGGAIFNDGKIDNIYAEFSGNTVNGYGGAIYNSNNGATIGKIEGKFTENAANNAGNGRYGGAIYNAGTIEEIKADFSKNYASTRQGPIQGGAIWNSGTITTLNGNFSDNYAKLTNGNSGPDTLQGGAIYNADKGNIGTILGDFTNNSAAQGGAIYNAAGGTIASIGSETDITNFSGNEGDAVIHNAGTIGTFAEGATTSTGGGIWATFSPYTDGKTFARAIQNDATGKIGLIKATFSNHNFTNTQGGFINNLSTTTNGETKGGFIDTIDAVVTGNTHTVSENYIFSGLIYNQGTINNIKGTYSNNTINSSYGNNSDDGIISNDKNAHIGTIDATFDGNKMTSNGSNSNPNNVVFNNATIDNILGTFSNNSVSGNGDATFGVAGAAIYQYNYGHIGTINATFTGNHVENTNSNAAKGGAIINYSSTGTIDSIQGTFKQNYAKSASGNAQGGAIYNAGTIGTFGADGKYISGGISGNFSGNYAQSTSGAAQGGAIWNSGKIGDIQGADMTITQAQLDAWADEYVKLCHPELVSGSGDSANNEALQKAKDDLLAQVKASLAPSPEPSPSRGEGDVTAHPPTQLGDSAETSSVANNQSGASADAPAPQSEGDITFRGFFGNHAVSTGSTAADGAKTSGTAYGGAIYNVNNVAAIGKIDANFVANYANSADNNAAGGAVYNAGTIAGISGDFVGNRAEGASAHFTDATYYNNGNAIAQGGAIYNANSGKIENLSGNFKNNLAHGTYKAVGGAINNSGTIGGDLSNMTFEGNRAESNAYAGGGAIVNFGTIGNLTNVTFTNNSAYGGIGNYNNISESKNSDGGAIMLSGGTIGTIQGTFSGNSAYSASNSATGGAISAWGSTSKSTTITGIKDSTFTNNYAESVNGSTATGGALFLDSSYLTLTNGITNSVFTGNYAKSDSTGTAMGGAIRIDANGVEIKNSIFTGNYAQSNNTNDNSAMGGAIYTAVDLKITADGSETAGSANVEGIEGFEDVESKAQTLFHGNYVQKGDDESTRDYEAIYIYQNGNGGTDTAKTLTLEAKNQGTIQFDDKINGTNYNLALTGDAATSTIILNNDVKNAAATLENVTLKLGVTGQTGAGTDGTMEGYTQNTSDVFKASTLQANSGVIDTHDGKYTNYNFQKLESNADVHWKIDGVLNEHEQKADTFTVGAGSTGTITLDSINIVSDFKTLPDKDFILQIIKAENGKDAPQLSYTGTAVLQEAEAQMKASETMAEGLSLWTTNTTNDSLRIRGLKDNLAEWAELEVAEGTEKKFTIDNDTHNLTRDVKGNMKGKKLEIAGDNGENKTLNLNDHSLFGTIDDGQTVSLSDLTINNSSKEFTNSGNFSMESTKFTDEDTKFTNAKDLTISGESGIAGTLTNTGHVTVNDGSNLTLQNLDGDEGELDITGSTVEIGGNVSGNSTTTDISGSTVDITGTVSGDSTTTTIESDSTVTYGGAVSGGSRTTTIEGSDVTYEGTVSGDSAETTISDSEVTYGDAVSGEGRQTTISEGSTVTYGGAVSGNNATTNITGSTVIYNSTVSGDGATTIADNSTVTYAGAVTDGGANTTITSSTVKYNDTVGGDNAQTTISGGTVTYGGEISGTGRTLTAKDSAKLTLNGDIIGENSTVNVNSSNLTLGHNTDDNKNNVLATSDTTVSGSSTVHLKDNQFTEYNIHKLTSDGSSKWETDIEVKRDGETLTKSADTFKVGAGSEGEIFLDFDENAIDFRSLNDEEEVIIQIVETEDGENAPQINFKDADTLKLAEAQAVMENTDELNSGYERYTTKTENDSIRVRGWKDNLAAWGELETDEDKTFTLVDGGEHNEHTLTRDLTDLEGTNLTVKGNGKIDLNLQEHDFFGTIENGQTVTMRDMEIKNSSKTATNQGTLHFASVTDSTNIDNSGTLKLSGKTNISGAINNEGGNIEIFTETGIEPSEESQVTLNTNITGTGDVLVNNAEVIVGGENPDKGNMFASSNVTMTGGKLSLNDSTYTDYRFGSLKSDEASRYSVDLKLSKTEQKSDKFIVGGNSSGVIYLDNLNITVKDGETVDKEHEYVLQVIDAQDSTTAPELKYDNAIVLQEAHAHMTSSEILAEGFGLATTKTHHDSIKLRGWKDNLAAWAQFEGDEDGYKSFTFKDGGTHDLTRNIHSSYYEGEQVKGLVGGDLRLIGKNGTLDLGGHDLLSKISDTQHVQISDLTITGSTAEMNNQGTFDLKSVKFTDDETKLNNQSALNISGTSQIAGTLTNTGTVTVAADSNLTLNNLAGDNGTLDITSSTVEIQGTVAGDDTKTKIKEGSKVTYDDTVEGNERTTTITDSTVTYSGEVSGDDSTTTISNSTTTYNGEISGDNATTDITDSTVTYDGDVSGDNATTIITDNSTVTYNGTVSGNDSTTEITSSNVTYNGEISGNNRTITAQDNSELHLNGDITGENNTVTVNNSDLYLGNTTESGQNNVLEQSTLNVENSRVKLNDGEYTNYNIEKLESDGDSRYSIDLELDKDNKKADTFTVGEGSNGKIYLDSLSISGIDVESAEDENRYVVQIIKSQTDDIQLDFDNSRHITEAQAQMTSAQVLAKEFGLTTTTTTNDSIVLAGWRDPIAAWAELDVADDINKTYTFVDGSVLKVTRDITELKGKDLAVLGNGNTLDINNSNIFSNIDKDQKLAMSNISLTNLPTVNNDGTLTLDNVTLESTSEIDNNGELTLKNMDIEGTIVNEGETTIEDTKTNITGKIQNKQTHKTTDEPETDTETTETNTNIQSTGRLQLKNSTVDINGEVSGQKIIQEGGVTTLYAKDTFLGNSLDLTNGEFNIPNLGLTELHLNELALHNNGEINIRNVEVDLENQKMGRITADDYTATDGQIVVQGMTLVSDSELNVTPVKFADEAIKDRVQTDVNYVPGSNQNYYVYSPIHKYFVDYSTDGTFGEGGYFLFLQDNGINGPKYGTFNPAVLASSVMTQAAGQSAINETFRYVFEHADAFTKFPEQTRQAAISADKYAISTDFNHNLGSLCPEHNNQGGWVRPYAAFETINLDNGPKVGVISYGTIAGYDSDFRHLKNGWTNVGTGYIGYSGSEIHYTGVSGTMNGGLLGVTETFYKNNFWTAITATAGAGVSFANTMYGQEAATMMMAGIGAKTGYNWELSDGKYIIQPIMFMSYTFVNTFDYTNAAGVRIDSDPMHTIQLNPSIRFIGNFKNGWQPYASVGMVWNLMNSSSVTANNIPLPDMHVKPYIEYGLGLQKNWGDRFTAFGQAMVRNGGRNGVALTAGFRWALGKDSSSPDMVHEREQVVMAPVPQIQPDKKVIKQLPQHKKARLQNTSRTTYKADVREL